MKPDDDVAFAEIMGMFGEAFDKPSSPEKIEIYFQCLKDLDIEAIKQAAIAILNHKTISTFPLVAEIREAAENQLPMDTQAILAWDKFMYALQNHCPYDSVQFDDPVISQIVRAWCEWPQMGEWREDERHFWRKEFMRLYAAYSKAYISPNQNYHVGITESENRRKGFLDRIPAPVFITSREGTVKGIPLKTQEIKCLES